MRTKPNSLGHRTPDMENAYRSLVNWIVHPCEVLSEPGTPLPEHVCADCEYYIRDRVDSNCRMPRGTHGSATGHLNPACRNFKPSSKDRR